MNKGVQHVTGLPDGTIYTMECRTPSWYTGCVSCGQTFFQMMWIFFRLHPTNASQWQVMGWQCFDCERKDRESESNPHPAPSGEQV